jgi:hypothetical protein
MNTPDYLAAHTPAPTATVSPAILAARDALDAAGRELAGIDDAALERPWRWRDHDADVRYGLFRAVEAVDQAAAEVEAVLRATGAARSAAARLLAPSTTARWALHGRLVAMDDDWLDRTPKAGEWTLRETLGHIVGSQRGYAAYNAWYWSRAADTPPTDAERAAIDAEAQLPEEREEGAGSIGEIRARMDETTDRGAAHLAGIPEADLTKRAFWSGIPVDLAFRLGRPASHTIEHSIQVDKTLAWLDRRPSEAERIVRELYNDWGRLEAMVFPIEPAALSKRDPQGRSVEAILAGLSTELGANARSVMAAAAA